jgi:hypothetical protein
MRVHGSFKSDRDPSFPPVPRGFAGQPPLLPVPRRPSWLQRMLGINWDKPKPPKDRL